MMFYKKNNTVLAWVYFSFLITVSKNCMGETPPTPKEVVDRGSVIEVEPATDEDAIIISCGGFTC